MKPNGKDETKGPPNICSQLNHYYEQIAAVAKPAFTIIIMILITSEVSNFISLKGH